MTERIPRRRVIDGRAAVLAGLLAGVLFLLLEMAFVPLFGLGSAWGPPRMIAAMVLGADALPGPLGVTGIVFFVAIAVHLALSVVFALPLAFIVEKALLPLAPMMGVFYGLGLYFLNYYVFVKLFPWFAEARNSVSIMSHVVFGVAAAYIYEELALAHRKKARRERRRTDAPTARPA